MLTEKYDFYAPSNINLKDLPRDLQNNLYIMTSLDYITQVHSGNVANLCTRICQYLRCNNKFTLHCMVAGYIHDIGKMFIPKEIINKPTALTDKEYEIMKTHTTLGYNLCMKNSELREFSDGPYYHHEALNGSGYPQGLTKKDIPYSAQIIRVADEYDALVTKRQYTTHVDISKTLKQLIKDANPPKEIVALDHLKQSERLGKINKEPLRALFKVVIVDTQYEIASVMNYIEYINAQIRRLQNIQRYEKKMLSSKKDETKKYYLAGMNLLFENGENIDNYKKVLEDYKNAKILRQDRIKKLHKEIDIIKKLRV